MRANKLVLILLLALIIRSFGLNLMLIDDEAVNQIGVQHFLGGEYPFFMPHPPGYILSLYLYYTIDTLFFNFIPHHLPVRLLPLFFGLLTIVVVYYFTRSIYDDRTAFLAAGIMSISFYHILASLQVEKDGSLLAFFIALTLYSYYQLIESRKRKWLLATSVLFGLTLMLNYVAVVILPILIMFDIFYSKLKNIREIFFISVISSLIFSLFPIITFLIDKPEIFLTTIKWGMGNISSSERVSTSIVKSIVKHGFRLVQYGTPLLVFLPLVAFMKRQYKGEYLLFSWVSIFVLLYVFVIPSGDIPRYQMQLLPPLCILTARGVLKVSESFSARDLQIGVLATLVFAVIVFALNLFSFTTKPLSFEYFDASIVLKNPAIWYTSTSGPLFQVSFFSLLFVVFLSIALIITYAFLKDVKFKRNIAIMFIALNLAFNAVLAEEFLFYGISPNYSKVIQDMVHYHEENNLPDPLYSVTETFPYYLNKSYDDYASYSILSKGRKSLGKEGGTVMWLNIPPLYEGSPMTNVFNAIETNCRLKKTFYHRGNEAGYIYLCNKTVAQS